MPRATGDRATSASMWPASASNAREPETTATTTSTTMNPTINPSAIDR
jgi:hypothetical protein